MLLLVLNLDNSECFEARLEQLIQALRSTKPLFFGAIQGHEFAVSHGSAIGITDWAGIALMTTSGFFLGGGLQKEPSWEEASRRNTEGTRRNRRKKEQKEEGRKEGRKEGTEGTGEGTRQTVFLQSDPSSCLKLYTSPSFHLWSLMELSDKER